MPADRSKREHWCSRSDLCRMLGMSESGVDKIRRSLGNVAEDGTSPIRFFMPEWLRAWAQYTAGVLSEDGEPESDEGGWLEEKRKWDAKQSQLTYEQKCGRLVPVGDAKKIVVSAGEHIRQAAETMCHECQEKIDIAISRSHEELARHFADDSPDDNEFGESVD